MRYDPGHVRRYFDEYGSREWDRLASSLEGQVNFHMHQKFLLEYVHSGDRVLEVGPGPGLVYPRTGSAGCNDRRF